MAKERKNYQLVGNKPKGQISKRMFQENKACQIFRKTNISYPLIRTRTYVYQGVRNVRFPENLAYFASSKHRFWDSSFWLLANELARFAIFSFPWPYWAKIVNGQILYTTLVTGTKAVVHRCYKKCFGKFRKIYRKTHVFFNTQSLFK